MAQNSQIAAKLCLPSCPGMKIAILNDVHIGIHDEDAVKVLIECFEREGVDFVVANGDIHDCGPVSRHAGKAALARLESGQLAEEAASGRWIVDWMATRPCIYGTGNHEDWINDLAISTGTVGTLTVSRALGLPEAPGFVVAPHGYQIRFGSLVIEHGDCIFSRGGSGPANLARGIFTRFPGQTSLVGHFHRQDAAWFTSFDSAGIARSHAAFCVGHLSKIDAHIAYAGRAPNWQQGGAIVETWRDGVNKRFTVHLLEIHRDRNNRPILQFNGRLYR